MLLVRVWALLVLRVFRVRLVRGVLRVQVKRERQVHRETLGLLDRKAKLALKVSQAQQEMTALQVLQALKVNRGPQERVLQVRPDPWVRLDPQAQAAAVSPTTIC